MGTLDRYIIRQFLINFVILMTVLMTLFVVVDLIVELDEFVEAGRFYAAKQKAGEVAEDYPELSEQKLVMFIGEEATAEEVAHALGWMGRVRVAATDENEDAQATPVQSDKARSGVAKAKILLNDVEPGGVAKILGFVIVLVDYYGPAIIMVYLYLSGLIVVGAMGFTLTAMQRHRELTAVVGSGVSLYRVALPILVTGVLLNGLTLPLQEIVIPPLADKLTRSKSELKHVASHTTPMYLVPDGNGSLFSTPEFDADEEVLVGLSITERDEQRMTSRRVQATRAKWDAERGGWVLTGGYEVVPFLSDEELRERQLEGAKQIDFYETDLSPTVLLARRAETYASMLSLADLQSMKSNDAVDTRLKNLISKTMWSRFSLVAINCLVLLMATPAFLKLTNINPLAETIGAIGVALGSWSIGVVGLQMPPTFLNAMATAWLPVVVLLPISFAMLTRVRT